jgi:hypothetical protein
MLFAKLFSYSNGQLVVTWDNPVKPESKRSRYRLTTITRGEVVTARMEHGYPMQAQRDADFTEFDEQKAARLFKNQQQFLKNMGEKSMMMEFAKLFSFGPAEGLPEGQLLVLVQDSDAREDADAPYQLVLTTMSPYGRIKTLVYPYADEHVRDNEFTDLVPLAAEGHYRHMQAELATEFQLATA